MAIFCTNETRAMVEKYRGFFNEGLHNQVSIIMGKDKMMEEKHVDMLEELIDKHYKYIGNIHELSYKDKIDYLLWRDIFDCIQVTFDRHQKEDSTFDVDLSVIEKDVATILTPMIFGDLFYYTRELKNFRQLKPNAKTPADIVEEWLSGKAETRLSHIIPA